MGFDCFSSSVAGKYKGSARERGGVVVVGEGMMSEKVVSNYLPHFKFRGRTGDYTVVNG